MVDISLHDVAEELGVHYMTVYRYVRQGLLPATKRGRTLYRLRGQTVEPVFGQQKAARGFRQFLLRGLDKVRSEWAMICTVHNLHKLHAAAR